SYRFLKHPTKRHPIHDSTLDSKSDDPPRVLVHHDQYPVRPQRHRFTSEQVNAIKAVFRVTDEGEPGRSITVRRRMVMRGENTAHHILIYTSAKRQIDLLGNARTSHLGLRCFISTTARIKSWSGPFGPGFARRFGENRNLYLRWTRARWKFNRVDGLNAIADRKRRFGRIHSEHKPAMNRSKTRRFGARRRERFTIRR